MKRFIHQISASLLLSRVVQAEPLDQNPGQLVEEVHAASVKQRESLLRKTIAKTDAWSNGTCEDILWMKATRNPKSLTLPVFHAQLIMTLQKTIHGHSFLNAAFGENRISVTVGPLRCVIDLQSK